MEDDDWAVSGNWHDDSALQLAMPEAVQLAKQIIENCKTTNSDDVESGQRPNQLLANIAAKITSIIRQTRENDAKKLRQAARSLEKRDESNQKLRWLNHCIATTVVCSLDLAHELQRTDNAHRARLAKREDELISAIEEAADAWRTRGKDS